MKRIKHLICAILIVSFTAPQIHADEHLYFKGDIQSGNLWTMFINIGIAAWINNSTNQYTYDSFLTMSGVSNSNDQWHKRIGGFKLHDLFTDYGTGIKLGYKSDNFSFFNWAAYGSLHYKVNYFTINTIYYSPETDRMFHDYENTIHKFQIGIGANVTLGSPEAKARAILDFGLRYNIPFAYSGELGDGVGCLNSGISPIIGLTVGGGRNWMKKIGLQIGIWYEFGCYNIFKQSDYFDTDPYKSASFGINFTLCPWKKSIGY